MGLKTQDYIQIWRSRHVCNSHGPRTSVSTFRHWFLNEWQWGGNPVSLHTKSRQ